VFILPAANRPSTRGAVADARQLVSRPDHGIALPLRGLNDGLAGVRAGVDDLVEALLSATQNHVYAVIHRLLGDRAGAAIRFLVTGAVGHVRWTLTAAVVDVRIENCRRSVGDFRGRHVASDKALRQSNLENGLEVFVGAGCGGDTPVRGLAAGGPGGAGGGVGDVIGFARVGFLDGPGGCFARERQCVDTVDKAGCAAFVIAGDVISESPMPSPRKKTMLRASPPSMALRTSAVRSMLLAATIGSPSTRVALSGKPTFMAQRVERSSILKPHLTTWLRCPCPGTCEGYIRIC
jgi:hypothetical protein